MNEDERYGRAQHEGRAFWVRVHPQHVEVLSDAPWAGGAPTGRVLPLREVTLLAPVTPSKVVCVGRNYRAHAKELGNEVPAEPLLFLKPPSSVLDPLGTIALPPESARVEHEGELAVVVGQRLRRATPDEALAALFGFTCANDVTARDLQRKDVQFTRGKGFDTFCPLGPWIVRGVPAGDAAITVTVDGATRQHGYLRDMVFPVAELVAFISAAMTLEPGDVVLTGTPEGVGPLTDGAVVRVAIEGVGTLENTVRAERK